MGTQVNSLICGSSSTWRHYALLLWLKERYLTTFGSEMDGNTHERNSCKAKRTVVLCIVV